MVSEQIEKLERRLGWARAVLASGLVVLFAMLALTALIGEPMLVLFALIFPTPLVMFGLGTATTTRRELEEARTRPQLPTARIVR